MNKLVKGLSIIFLFCAWANSLSAQRVIIIGLDGFSTQGFKAAKHPNIDALFAEGLLSLDTRPVMPSVTLPNWTSHLSGAGPEEHGVTSNAWKIDHHDLNPVEADSEGYFPSVFKLLKEKKPGIKTAFYYNWADLINSMNKKYIDEIAFEDQDGYKKNYAAAVDFMEKNKADPQLVFLYSVRVDHAGHEFKWMSDQYIAIIQEADTAIGNLVANIKAKGLYEDTYFLLITDHGGLEKGHGGTSMVEMQIPWAITGPRIKHAGLVHMLNSNRNTSIVIARIFGIKKLPASWTGQLPDGIFK